MQDDKAISQYTTRNILIRDFVLGFLAAFAFSTAAFTLIPTLPIYFVRSGCNLTDIGVLVGVYGATSLVVRLLVGRILLRYSEKIVMMVGALLFALTFLAFILFRSFWPFLVTRFCQGVAFACLDTAALALIVNVISLAYRGQALGYFLLAPTFALAVAPSFGMFIINQYNFTVLFLLCAGLSLCAFVFSFELKGKGIVALKRSITAENNSFIEWKIITPAITSLLHNFVWGTLTAFLPLYAIQSGIENPGFFFSAMAFMMIMGRVLGGRILDICSKEKIILAFVSVSIVALVILCFSQTLSMYVVAGLFWGLGGAFIFPASMAYALDYAGSSSGAAVGTFRALMDLGVSVGPMIMGVVLTLTSYRVMFLCLVSICLINLTYFQFCVRKKR